jgi:hypothetical protein
VNYFRDISIPVISHGVLSFGLKIKQENLKPQILKRVMGSGFRTSAADGYFVLISLKFISAYVSEDTKWATNLNMPTGTITCTDTYGGRLPLERLRS